MKATGLPVTVLLLFGAVWVARPTAAADPAKPFTDVTVASGVAAVVEAHYARVPEWWLSGFDLIDLDGDDDLDLLLAGHGHPAAAARNDGKGHFTYVDPELTVARGVRHDHDIPYPGGEIRLAHDFDEDGRIDLLAAYGDGLGASYLNASRSLRPPLWRFQRRRFLDRFSRATALADLNRDGRVDYLADTGRGTAIAVLFGRGDGTFDDTETLVAGGLRESGAIPADVDGDGDLDLLVSQRGYHAPGRRILLAAGGLTFTNHTRGAGLAEDDGSIHGVGDVDQDGDPDLICIEGDAVVLYINDGRGRFRRRPDAVTGLDAIRGSAGPRHTNWGGAVVTDVDNDGAADILINGRYFIYVLRRVGAEVFALSNETWGLPAAAWSAVDEGLCFGDIDGDGDLDLVMCSGGSAGTKRGVAVFRNDLPRQHWLRVRPIGRRGNRAATGATIRIYEAGSLGSPDHLVWYEQIAVWGRQSFHSHYAATVTERHVGLGRREAVDVSVEFYPSGRRVQRRNVAADSTVSIYETPSGN